MKSIQTAEAVIEFGTYLGKSAVFKKRVPKKYRVSELDERLRNERLTREANLLSQAKKAGVRTPQIWKIDRTENILVLEYIPGKKLETVLHTEKKFNEKWCGKFGKIIGKLHAHNLVHGDLTTSNVVVSVKSNSLILIDFGLGGTSAKWEDKAVDLLNLKKILRAGNSQGQKYWTEIAKGYKKEYKSAGKVLRQLQEVEERVRYARG